MSKVQAPIYMTIRVDIEYDNEKMNKQDAIDNAVSNITCVLNTNNHDISIEDVDICGVDLDCYKD